MVTTRQGKRNTYTIRGTDTTVTVGDCVLLRPTEGNRPIVARVEKFEQDNMDRKRVHVRRFYRPEEIIGGRKCFHGHKELFLSDDYDVHSADTIEGKCFVHTFGKKLEYETANDYFCRFSCKFAAGRLTPTAEY